MSSLSKNGKKIRATTDNGTYSIAIASINANRVIAFFILLLFFLF
ncbi:hypothetical protein [Streptococcus pyogenes SSI-1]|nr:hypothetical protein [Streptococcus pyogenes SSI-1]